MCHLSVESWIDSPRFASVGEADSHLEIQIDMASTSEKVDIERTKKTAEHVFDVLGGALVSGMIYLGDRMGLYQALNGAGAVTSEELALKTGCTNGGFANGSMGRQRPALSTTKAKNVSS
jgi:hypothetical protein